MGTPAGHGAGSSQVALDTRPQVARGCWRLQVVASPALSGPDAGVLDRYVGPAFLTCPGQRPLARGKYDDF